MLYGEGGVLGLSKRAHLGLKREQKQHCGLLYLLSVEIYLYCELNGKGHRTVAS